MPPHVPIDELRDTSGYSARNSSNGALNNETFAIFSALSSGRAFDEVRNDALYGSLFRQRSAANRNRIWHLIQRGYFEPAMPGIRETICAATAEGRFTWELCLAEPPWFDEVANIDRKQATPTTIAEFVAQESAYVPDLNDAVRVNVAR